MRLYIAQLPGEQNAQKNQHRHGNPHRQSPGHALLAGFAGVGCVTGFAITGLAAAAAQHKKQSRTQAGKNRNKGKRIEQLANSFAAALLMPRASLDKLIDRDRLDDIAHLCEVAALLRVAPVTLAWRLFNLKLIGDDTRRSLSQEKQRPSVSGPPKRFSPTFVKMLHEALENGRLSARKAAKAIGLGLGGLIELFAQYDLTAPFEL